MLVQMKTTPMQTPAVKDFDRTGEPAVGADSVLEWTVPEDGESWHNRWQAARQLEFP